MKIATIKIADDVAKVLIGSTIKDGYLHLPFGQLPPKLYADTAKVLKALGIVWERKAGAHKLPANDVGDQLRAALSTGSVVDRKKTLQLFETPALLAAQLVDKLDVQTDDHCLEPSAGHGRIVSALFDCGAPWITVVEIDTINVQELIKQDLAAEIHTQDFLAMTFNPFDVIAMNPPFTGNQDIKHVRHAYSMLAPGGRLGAIMSSHAFHASERESTEFRAWLAQVGAEVTIIPAGAFNESGTTIETRMVIIRKPA